MTAEEAYRTYIPAAVAKVCTGGRLAALNMTASDVAGEVYVSMCEKDAIDGFAPKSRSAARRHFFEWTRRVVARLFRATNYGKENERKRMKEYNATPERKAKEREREKKRAKQDRTAYMKQYMKWYRKRKKAELARKGGQRD